MKISRTPNLIKKEGEVFIYGVDFPAPLNEDDVEIIIDYNNGEGVLFRVLYNNTPIPLSELGRRGIHLNIACACDGITTTFVC